MDWSRIIDIIETKTGASIYKIVGCRSQYVSDLKSGKSKNPGADFVLKLIERFNLNPNWLLTGEGEMFRDTEIAKPESARIPLLRQTVSCGPGKTWEHEDNIEDWIVPWDAFPRPANGRLYAFHAEGISMAGAGISSGDILIFDGSHDQDATDDIYVFSLFGAVYCKLIRFDGIGRRIHILEMPDTENPKQAVELRVISMDDPAADDFRILGRVLAWIHENRVIRK